MSRIDHFMGEYRFLSNFYPATIKLGEHYYPTVEHAFQAMKTEIETERENIRHAESPGEAKRLGRRVSMRGDWEQIKEEVMYYCLKLKFAPGTWLAKKLVETGDLELVEGNHWNDRYWGVCGGIGHNRLGVLLMRVRKELVSG